jgi:hypothetical protein
MLSEQLGSEHFLFLVSKFSTYAMRQARAQLILLGLTWYLKPCVCYVFFLPQSYNPLVAHLFHFPCHWCHLGVLDSLDCHSCVLTSQWLHWISKQVPGQALVRSVCSAGERWIMNYTWFLYFTFPYALKLSPPPGKHCSRQFVWLVLLILFAYFMIIIHVHLYLLPSPDHCPVIPNTISYCSEPHQELCLWLWIMDIFYVCCGPVHISASLLIHVHSVLTQLCVLAWLHETSSG